MWTSEDGTGVCSTCLEKAQPKAKTYRILTLDIVVDDADAAEIADEINGLLSENGVCADGAIVDWRYHPHAGPTHGEFVKVEGEYVEGDAWRARADKWRVSDHD
jgi:hypothetical protein